MIDLIRFDSIELTHQNTPTVLNGSILQLIFSYYISYVIISFIGTCMSSILNELLFTLIHEEEKEKKVFPFIDLVIGVVDLFIIQQLITVPMDSRSMMMLTKKRTKKNLFQVIVILYVWNFCLAKVRLGNNRTNQRWSQNTVIGQP